MVPELKHSHRKPAEEVAVYLCISSQTNGCSQRTVACFIASALAQSEAETAVDLFQRSR